MRIVTEEDLDAAIKEPWSTDTCIVAQCAKRYGEYVLYKKEGACIPIGESTYMTDMARILMSEFDKVHGARGSHIYDTIRSKLPIKI